MGCASNVCNAILQYDTVKFVTVRNKKIGLLYRIVQLTILGYILGYVIIFKKGYQDISDIESAVTTKVKGVLYTNFSKDEFVPEVKDYDAYRRLWDVPDYVVPPSENGAFFIATNVIITSNQNQSTCAEDPSVSGALCSPEFHNCTAGEILPLGNGVLTGDCVSETYGNKTIESCEIEGWCPLERDVGPLLDKALLADTKSFTVLIKNFISFPKYGVTRRNVLDTSDAKYLNNCKYSPITDKQCPVFVLEDIVANAGENYTQMAIKGGVIAIIIDWTCDLDFSKDYCIPTYSFKRLDVPDAKLAKGWNFRYANYFRDSRRTLYKLYGINFVILVRGSGGKFNFIPLFLNIGSGIGLLAVATVISDIVVLYCVKKRKLYESEKYTAVQTEYDGFDGLVPRLRSQQTEAEGGVSPNDLSYERQYQ